MRNIKPLIPIILSAVCLFLFTQCTNTSSTGETNKERTLNVDSINGIRIVYVDLDTIMYRYDFAVDINKEMISRETRIKSTLKSRREQLEEEITEFEYKCNAKTFSSESQYNEEREEIINKEQEFFKLRDELYMQLETETLAKNKELRDTINNYIREHNKEKGYDFIITKIGDNILYANSTLNITMEIVDGLNKRYRKNKK